MEQTELLLELPEFRWEQTGLLLHLPEYRLAQRELLLKLPESRLGQMESGLGRLESAARRWRQPVAHRDARRLCWPQVGVPSASKFLSTKYFGTPKVESVNLDRLQTPPAITD
jgi:hypothetical protein